MADLWEDKLPLFFMDLDKIKEIQLKEEQIQHLKSLRMYSVDKLIEVRDGKGNSHIYRIPAGQTKGFLQREEYVTIEEKYISLATAIPKSSRFEFLIQKGTEIGVTDFNFINFQQSERKDLNPERVEKIIREAASQSRRHSLPRVKHYKSLDKFIEENPKGGMILHPYSEKQLDLSFPSELPVVIGPEGGLRDKEINQLLSKGFLSFSLGTPILRIETACLYMASIMKFRSFL
ncbi:MAG: 16S rRNA (uracil(1498)-N(3))-methyltransferase [Leptospiraceae bacterium]|nr:16S rRNA (uracil(1498)-N(3))-methyltransferase [Leptospiraceae bacterium]MCP5502056.1 16S rRNA (uracil(1498)-N(3))-methyltransferase [Leptospiraceae bacterium]